MSTVDLEDARWHRSSRSSDGGNANCVEVALVKSGAAVRDSKNPDGPVLTIPLMCWVAFLGTLS